MYCVKGDGIIIYNDIAVTESAKAVSPKLTLSDNAAGSLEITLPPGNAGYSSLKHMKSVITVFRNNEEIWSGRIVSEKKDFWNNRVLTCEGELAYLNDTLQPPKQYSSSEDSGVTVLDFLTEVIKIHNQNADDEKQFYVDESYIFNYSDVLPIVCTNYESTLDTINTNLIEYFGGHIQVKKKDGKRYLYFFKDGINTNTQVIRFGQNLLDFTTNWDLTDLATVIIPRGAKLNESDISENIEAYVTIGDAGESNDDDIVHDGIYLISKEAVENYGRIEQVVDFSDVTDPDELLEKAISYIKDIQFDSMKLEISAVDLHYLNPTSEPMRMLDKIRCISRPHGLNKLFPVTELSIQLDKRDNAKYTLGETETKTLSSSTTKSNSEIVNKINNLPTKQSILKKAKENADILIKETTNGFVTIQTNDDGGRHSEALIISPEQVTSEKTLDDIDHYWIWNINGLAHYKKGEETPNVAITMDGAIVADFITTGTMSADRIRTGQIVSEDKNVIWDLNEGGSLTIKKGSISLGNKFGNWSGTFCVDDSGVMHASEGTIAGFTIKNDEIYNDVITLTSDGLAFRYEGDALLGKYGTNSWENNSEIKGLTVDVEYDTSYIAWGYKEASTSETYAVKLMYTAKKFSNYAKDSLNIECNLDLHDYVAKNFWIDPNTGGVEGGCNHSGILRLPERINSETGSVITWLNVKLKNGVLIPT